MQCDFDEVDCMFFPKDRLTGELSETNTSLKVKKSCSQIRENPCAFEQQHHIRWLRLSTN